MRIIADASLPGLSLAFPPPFQLSFFHSLSELRANIQQQDILLCRATIKVDEALLAGSKVSILATATSGTDHIDTEALNRLGVRLIDARGANAHAVADYLLYCLAFLEINHGIRPGKAGIIGVGRVGELVKQRLQQLGWQTLTYDPPRALRDPDFNSVSFQALNQCQLLCVHAAYHETPPYSSKHLINRSLLENLQAGSVIINAARGDIVDEEALLSCRGPLLYCTDVYQNEPAINPQVIDFATLCTPHIAGHTLEAKYEAVQQISAKLHQEFHWPVPAFTQPVLSKQPVLMASWQETLLSVYNPESETQALKQAKNLQEAFLQSRRAHHRHDLRLYPSFASLNL